ncbi:hypothetical protein DITRI_Ditri04bG0177900 [Diplodiscus trichospermus]
MRTRFINTDYFTTSQSPTGTLNFLNLPPPHLPPSHFSIFNDDFLHFDAFLSVPLLAERLPIDAALSKFLSEAIPQFIDVDFKDFEDTRSSTGNVDAGFSEKEAMVCNEKEAGSQITSRAEILEKDNVTSADGKDMQRFEVILFETPELDTFLDNVHFSEKEIETFSAIPEIDNNQDATDPIVQYSEKIQESVYSVEDVTSEINMDQDNYMLEEDSSFGDQVLLQHRTFRLLEVDEISLGIMRSYSMDDELPSVLDSIESQLWTPENNLLIDSKELLGSINDILEFLSDHCLAKQFPEAELSFPEMFLDLNLICMVETPQVNGNSEFYLAKHDADYFFPLNMFIFEEFQIFDVDSSQNFEVFLNGQMTHEPEACNQMFREDMNLKSFNELVVSHELALVDETFKSLPVPVISDYRRMRLTCTVLEKSLSELKPLPLSASDGIYLDWYILEEDKCNYNVYSLFQIMVKEIDSYNINFDQEIFEDKNLVFNFIFLDDELSGSATEQYEEAPKVSSDSFLNGPLMAVASSNLQDNGCPKRGNSGQLAEKDAKRASLLFKSMSQFNDLDFFLDPQKGSARENAGPAALSINPNATSPNASSAHSVEACASAGVHLQKWDIMVCSIKLSNDIVALIENFEKSYLAILQNETELISFLPTDNFELLSLPKQKLMECIKKKMARRTTSHIDEDVTAFVTLCAIKQMASYMCFYGIHPAHLYVDKLWRCLGCMKSRLHFLHSLIEDACGKVDMEITRSHPSLCVIQEILQSNTCPSSSKVLILADQVFWSSLKRLLLSMGLSWNELSSFYTSANPSDADKLDSQLISDCWLVSQEHVSASFPFNKFDLIVEYGGLCGSSRVSSFSPKSVGLTLLHFLKIELDGSSASKALCEGVDMPQTTKKLMEECDSVLVLDDNVNYEKLEGLLDFVPIEHKYNKRYTESQDKVDAHCMPLPVAAETKLTQQRMVDIVIIVNTQNFDKEMIISRRSTYQKILAMEKGGAQVVERDSNLPVDVIISSSICLVWYDCRNIGRKAATLDEASSCLPSCIEYFATNVLTLLSFTFCGCFLVFEGEIDFLSAVMEYSAGLYAAAASLGIDFQLFCSYSSELTDEIILKCIDYAAKMTRGLYSKMPDTETLAESFLTKFPSLNPLTAHAILSSGGILIEFLEWSHERRIQAIQKYRVPDESVALFSALCKYSEREDSKSIMTDCSSSVSSGPDSDKCHPDVGSEGKQVKRINSPHKISIGMDEFMHFDPLNQCTDAFLNPSGKSYDSWMSKGSEMFQDHKKCGLSLNDIFDQKQEFDFPAPLSPQIHKKNDTNISEGSKMLDKAKKARLSVPLEDNMWRYNQGENMAKLNSLNWENVDNFENWHKDLVGEVSDLTDSQMSIEDFSSIDNSIPLSSLVPETEKDSTRKSKIARRLSFGKGSDTIFPYVSEINLGSDMSSSIRYPRQSFQRTNDKPDTGYKDKLPPSSQENLMEDVLAQGSAACKGSLLKINVSNHSTTPLSKAILSAGPQSGSPWTIEFLNRIREKSRLRQKNLPSDTSASPFEISGNIAKAPKRRSPSILEFFRYQGGSTPRKILEQRKQKRYLQSSISSKNEKTSSSLMQTFTPIDKRTRQTLSFAMNDGGSQTKLVWSDGSAPGLSKKLRNQ